MKRQHQLLNEAILNAWPNVTFIYYDIHVNVWTYGVCDVAQVLDQRDSVRIYVYLLKNEIIEFNEHLVLTLALDPFWPFDQQILWSL